MAAGTTFTWKHALQLHSTLSPFDSPLSATHSGFKDVRPVSWQRRNIAGLLLTIYGLSELPVNVSEVTCVWLLHGRGDTQDSMSFVAAAFINAWNAHCTQRQQQHPQKHHPSSPSCRPVVCIAFDQRNHGSRLVDNLSNVSWKQSNPTHGPDMFSLYSGTASDLSHLLDHIQAYLPFKLAKHLAAGVSLGGHATWQLLANEPRVAAGIVVIGTPDYARLMLDRAVRSNLPSSTHPRVRFLGSPDFPPSLLHALELRDPAALLLGELDVRTGDEHLHHPPTDPEIARLRPILRARLARKKIICLAGARDGLVPYKQSEPFLTWLNKAVGSWAADLGIELEDFVDQEARHEFSAKMRAEAERWLCDLLAAEEEEEYAMVGSKL